MPNSNYKVFNWNPETRTGYVKYNKTGRVVRFGTSLLGIVSELEADAGIPIPIKSEMLTEFATFYNSYILTDTKWPL